MQTPRKVIISLAPVDYGQPDGPLPASELAEEILACHQAGASMVHFHVSDEWGQPTSDVSCFQEVVDRVRSRCDIIIEGSTGGVGVPESMRTQALDIPGVEMASLNMGSCNLFGKVYENPPDEIQRIVSLIKRQGIVPDMCFFKPGFFEALAVLREMQFVATPFVASVCLGFPGALPASVSNLNFMVSKLPPDSVWTLVHHGARDFSLLATAIAGGGNLRVGFEDSRFLAPRQRAQKNRELVEQARELVLLLGHELATPAETRLCYGLHASGTVPGQSPPEMADSLGAVC